MLTTKEVAEKIGAPVSTVKNWVSRLPVPSHLDSQGNRRYPDEALAVLEAIKHLRDDQRGYDSIRLIIEPALAPSPATAEPGIPMDEPRAYATEPKPVLGPSIDELRLHQVVGEAVAVAIAAQTDQSEKYARATYRIGELEAIVRGHEVERDRLAGELAQARSLLIAGERERQVERNRLVSELTEANARAAQFEATAGPRRSWWKIWG